MRLYDRRITLITFVCAVFLAGIPFRTSGGATAHAARRGPERHTQREGRLATPGHLRCPRDNTTSFTGRVLAYDRVRRKVFIRVRTDEETTEQFTIVFGRRGHPESFFRLRGEPFGARDWRRIETRTGRLRPGMRATVWACYEGDKPTAELINWMPPEG